MSARPISRRKFVKKSALTLSAASAVWSNVSGPFIRSGRAGEPGPNEKIRLGLIGSGGMGRGDLECFFLNPEVDCAVICDVDDAMSAKGVEICEKKRGKKPDTVKDFRRVLDRKDVDVVLVATPDHWHALPTVLACQAGKDVYVEKPASHNAWEGRQMVAAARKYNRVVQLGTQTRSGDYTREAIEYVRSGKLGKVHLAHVVNMKNRTPMTHQPDGAPPPGVDYDMWLGAAPKRPFNPN